MAPNFEIFQNIETMRMVSCFQAGLKLSVSNGVQVERHWNSRIEDCCAGGMGDDPYPEIEDMHCSRIEDCDP